MFTPPPSGIDVKTANRRTKKVVLCVLFSRLLGSLDAQKTFFSRHKEIKLLEILFDRTWPFISFFFFLTFSRID